MKIALNKDTKERFESSGLSLNEVINAGIDTIEHDPHGWKWLRKQMRSIIDAPDSEFAEATAEDLKTEARQKYLDA